MEVSDGKGCKEISSVIDSEPVIGEEQLELLMWLKDTVFCTYFEAFRALIPPGLGVNFVSKYRLGAKSRRKIRSPIRRWGFICPQPRRRTAMSWI